MSDIKLRRLLRQYLSESTPENAQLFMREYTRSHELPYEEEVDDMEVANTDIGGFDPESSSHIHEWIENNACFTHTDPHVYEFIVYIGSISNDGRTVHTFRNIGGDWDPTPEELIPAIKEAHEHGYKYICFYM